MGLFDLAAEFVSVQHGAVAVFEGEHQTRALNSVQRVENCLEVEMESPVLVVDHLFLSDADDGRRMKIGPPLKTFVVIKSSVGFCLKCLKLNKTQTFVCCKPCFRCRPPPSCTRQPSFFPGRPAR